jgi:TolB-like protein/Tfp pilus assembly protein PilF
MDRLLLVALLLALGYFAVDKFVLAPGREQAASAAAAPVPATPSEPQAATAADPKSIAVLAFANMSADEDNEYFSDGVSEEILNALAQIGGLKVAGRTSSFYFKGRDAPLTEIGATLGVAHVLEGSVRKQGDRLRITAQLIRVSDGFHLWSETFDGTDADIFALQESIAKRVTSELKVALDAGQQERLIDSGTVNPEAYALYLQATDIFNRREGERFGQAIAQLERALAIDPAFARAYSRMAALQMLSPEYDDKDVAQTLTDAIANARRALELQPNLAEPHAVIALALSQQTQYLAARAEFEQALSIDPNDLVSNLWYSVHLSVTGYQRARVERLKHVLAIDPLLPNALNHYGTTLEWQGDLDGARREIERARALGAANTDIFLAFVSLGQGRIAEARTELTRTVDTRGARFPPGTGAIIADGILQDGEARARALALVRELVSEPATSDSGILAWALLSLGANDEGLAMVAARPMNAVAWHGAVWGPRGQAVRTSTAFPEFTRKVGLAALWDQYGPPDLCRKDANGDYRCE